MHAQIGFMHRRNRMTAHHRMTVNAIDFALISGKEIAERGVTLQLRCTDNHRHIGLIENRFADFNRFADIADFR